MVGHEEQKRGPDQLRGGYSLPGGRVFMTCRGSLRAGLCSDLKNTCLLSSYSLKSTPTLELHSAPRSRYGCGDLLRLPGKDLAPTYCAQLREAVVEEDGAKIKWEHAPQGLNPCLAPGEIEQGKASSFRRSLEVIESRACCPA